MWRSCEKNTLASYNLQFAGKDIFRQQLLVVAHLSAAVVTLVALETFLVLVSLLVLDQSVALVKHSVAVAAFLPRLNKRVLLPQVNTYRK